MKTKTINKIITQKFEYWVKSIQDEKVKVLVQNNTIMTGGAIASMLLNEPVNDFDFYFRDKETTLAVVNYYVNSFVKNKEQKNTQTDGIPETNGIDVPISVKENGDRVEIVVKSAGIEAEGNDKEYRYFELDSNPQSNGAAEYVQHLTDVSRELRKNYFKSDFKPVFLSSNAITLSGDVQVVVRFYGDPSTIHENYDFVHCTNYWTSWDKQVVLNPKALECLLTKELVYIGSKYPVASICRVRKFIQRGWFITAGQLLKMLMQISKLNLEDISVLQEQLTGVDMAYFHEILEKIKSKDPTTVDFAYLSTLIDELF